MNNLTTSKTEHDSIDKRISILSEIYALFPSDSIFYSPNMPMHSWDGSTYEQREVILQKMSVIFPFKNIDDLIEHQQALGGTERHIHRIIYPTDIELSYRDTCDFANSIFRDILVNTPNVSLIQKDDFEVISFGNTLFQDKGVLQKLKNKDVCT